MYVQLAETTARRFKLEKKHLNHRLDFFVPACDSPRLRRHEKLRSTFYSKKTGEVDPLQRWGMQEQKKVAYVEALR